MNAKHMPANYAAQADAWEADFESLCRRFIDDLGCRMNYESALALCGAGHLKIGKLLGACVESVFASGDIASCDAVTLPAN